MVNAVVDSKCQYERSEIVAHFESQAVLCFGFTKPKQPILGTELSGVIAEVRPKVKHFKIH
jgi:hypothetical protein